MPPADPDLWFVIALVLAVLCIPSLVSSWGGGRVPRATSLTVLIAGGMMVYALLNKAGGYTFGGIPDVIARVVARYGP